MSTTTVNDKKRARTNDDTDAAYLKHKLRHIVAGKRACLAFCGGATECEYCGLNICTDASLGKMVREGEPYDSENEEADIKDYCRPSYTCTVCDLTMCGLCKEHTHPDQACPDASIDGESSSEDEKTDGKDKDAGSDDDEEDEEDEEEEDEEDEDYEGEEDDEDEDISSEASED